MCLSSVSQPLEVERETGDLYCSHCWAGQATLYWSMLSKATTYQDDTAGRLPARSRSRVQLNVFNLPLHRIPTDRLVHRLLRGHWLQQDKKPEHRDHPAMHSQLHTGELEQAQTPYPDSKGSPDRGRLVRKSIHRGWGSSVGKHSLQTRFSMDSSTTGHCIKKTRSLKDIFMISWMGKDRRKRGGNFKEKICSLSLKWNWRGNCKYWICY